MDSWKPTLSCYPLVILLGMALAGCGQEPPIQPMAPLEVVVSRPVQEPVEDWDTYTGLVEAKDLVEIRARIRGYIQEVKFKDGSEVQAGQELFLIEDGTFRAQESQARGQLELQKSKLKLAEERIAILKPLVQSGSAAKQELDKAQADKGEALGAMATAQGQIQEAELNIGYCRITAPISGRLSNALLTKGNLVNPAGGESLLTTLVSMDPMYVYFYVHERALLRYQKAALEQARKQKSKEQIPREEGEIHVKMALADGRDFSRKGVIDFIDNRVDPSTGTIKVRARFANPLQEDGRRTLTPGLFARLRVAVSGPYQAVLVADRALLTDQNLKYVLTVNKEKNNLVERVDLEPGRLQENGLRVIARGLNGDEWVIIEGATMVRPGVPVSPLEEPMPRRPGFQGTAATASPKD